RHCVTQALRRSHGGYGISPREGQLVKEVRIRGGQVEGDRPRTVIGDDAASQAAATGCTNARPSADEARVKGLRIGVAQPEDPFELAFEIDWPDQSAIRVANATAQPERVGAAVVGRGG